MTDSLYVTLELERASDEWRRRFVDAVLTKSRAAPRGAELRLVVRKEDYGASIEPSLGGASFAALLERENARQIAAESAIRLIINEAFRWTDGVGILLLSERHDGPERVEEISTDVDGAMARIRRARSTWFKLATPLRVFHISQVEAKLFQPLDVDGGGVATHYFRDYWVLAVDLRRARALVVDDLAQDGAALVGWLPPEVADEVSITGDDEPCILRRGGRVYFS